MTLVGRARELALASGVLAGDRGDLRIFLGAPGIGKTALLSDIADRTGAAVVAVNAYEKLWRHSGLSAVGAALGGARGAVVDDVLSRAPGISDFEVADELHRALHDVQGEQCVLLIDDIDEIDPSSAVALSYVLRRLNGTRISVIATATRVDAMSPFAGLPTETIEALTEADAIEVCRRVFRSPTSPGVVRIIAMFTGGNPTAITGIRLTGHELTGRAPVPLPLPLHDGPTGLGHRLPPPPSAPDGTDVLRLLALAPVTAADAIRTSSHRDVIDDLIDDGTVTQHRGLLRIADTARRMRIHAGMDAEERRRLHLVAARVHHGIDPRIERWHHSFVDEGTVDDVDLLEAAERFARDGDPHSAVEFAERALRHRDSDETRTEPLLSLSRTLSRHGFFDLAQLYLDRALASDTGGLRLEAATTMLSIADATGHTVDDVTVDRYVDGAATEDPRGSARLLADLARIRLRRGETHRARARMRTAIRLLDGAVPLEYRLIDQVCRIRTSADRDPSATEAKKLGLPAGSGYDADIELNAVELSLLMRILTATEQYDACRRRAALTLDRIPSPDPVLLEEIHYLLALNEVRAGSVTSAHDAVAQWRRLTISERADDASAALLLAWEATLQPVPDPAEIDARLRRGRELCTLEDNAALPAYFDVLEGGQALTAGRFEHAARVLREAERNTSVTTDPSLLRSAADLVEALWLAGHREEARERTRELEAATRQHPSRWATLALARARAVCDSDDVESTAFDAALALYTETDSRDEHRRLVAAQRRCRPDPPRTRVLAHPHRAEAGQSAELTTQEIAIVQLVNQGLHNREIAAAHFVSLRTVELRLTRIYRKLGANSRAHLVAIMNSIDDAGRRGLTGVRVHGERPTTGAEPPTRGGAAEGEEERTEA